MNTSLPEDYPKRGKPAAGVHVQFGRPNWVLLTAGTEGRRAWLDNASAHECLVQVWSKATAWLVSDYVLMPDHLHAFCAPHDLNFTLERWLSYWKSQFRRQHGRTDWTFQSGGWHHRLRHGESYAEKWLYVQFNPVRKGLVQRPEDWPYTGRVHELSWS